MAKELSFNVVMTLIERPQANTVLDDHQPIYPKNIETVRKLALITFVLMFMVKRRLVTKNCLFKHTENLTIKK